MISWDLSVRRRDEWQLCVVYGMGSMRWMVWDEWCEMSDVIRRAATLSRGSEYWYSYSEYLLWVLHTASCQTRMPGRHRRTFFAAPISTATPNTIYTQQAAKPACQEDTAVHFSQLLLAQLPPTQFTHSKLPNPHARKTSPYIFRSSSWHSYPEHSLHTASCQTRMPGRHRRTFFAAPIGTATPNTVYTQQAAKPACQEDTAVHFSQVLLAQLPRTPFTHSKLPNPHARKTSPYSFRSSYWQGYPEHSLHTASCQIRMPGRHHRKIFASPIGRATPNTVYAQQAAKPAWQEDTNAKFSHLLLAQLPRTQFTHSKRQTRVPGRHHRNMFASPIGKATPNTVYTQQAAESACQEDITAICSHLLLAGLPRTQFTHSKLPNPHGRKTPTQNFGTSAPIGTATPNTVYTQQAAKPACQEDTNAKFSHLRSYWHSYPEHSLHTARRQTRMPGRHQRKMFASPIGKATPNNVYTQQGAKPACQEDTSDDQARRNPF